MITLIALIITIIGAINWLVVGIFGFNVVSWITFGSAFAARFIYVLVGIAGAWLIYFIAKKRGRVDESYVRDRARSDM